jgi:hypothetical protein
MYDEKSEEYYIPIITLINLKSEGIKLMNNEEFENKLIAGLKENKDCFVCKSWLNLYDDFPKIIKNRQKEIMEHLQGHGLIK